MNTHPSTSCGTHSLFGWSYPILTNVYPPYVLELLPFNEHRTIFFTKSKENSRPVTVRTSISAYPFCVPVENKGLGLSSVFPFSELSLSRSSFNPPTIPGLRRRHVTVWQSTSQPLAYVLKYAKLHLWCPFLFLFSPELPFSRSVRCETSPLGFLWRGKTVFSFPRLCWKECALILLNERRAKMLHFWIWTQLLTFISGAFHQTLYNL